MFKNKLFFWIIALVILILLCKEKGFSAPCYGTHLPREKHFIIGIQNHIIFRRNLENDFGKLRSIQNFLLLSYGFKDWLSIDLKGGAGYIKQHSLDMQEVDYSTGFAGGYGFRLRLYDYRNFRVVLGFQHISVHPKKTSLNGTKNQAILDDWQGSFLVSYDISKITPYLGLKYSRIDYIHKQDGQRKRRMSDLTKTIGLVLGMDFNIDKNIWLNLEGQILDVKAYAVSLNYKF